MKINFPPLWQLLSPTFMPYWEAEDDLQIFFGGRDSGKTNFVAKRLIYDCLNEPYFRCILIRKVYAWVSDSQWLTVKDVVEELGLTQYFKFTTSPYKIVCLLNGNMFICRGADDVNSIKSIKDPTVAWFEEDICAIPERDYIIISQSLRSSIPGVKIRQYFTINPEIKGEDYEENWFWQRHWGEAHANELTFRDNVVVELEKWDKAKKEMVNYIHAVTYLVHHSTYKDNRWCPPSRQAFHESLKKKNPHYHNIFTLGRWGNRSNDGLFYNTFHRGKHILDAPYNPKRALHITWDFNVRPYVSLGLWQYYDDREQFPELWDRVARVQGEDFDKLIVKIGEIAGLEPRNRTKYVCEDFMSAFGEHDEALFVYGDPAGKHEDTRSVKGHNDYNIIFQELKSMNPRKAVSQSAPSISKRGEFICNIMGENAYGIALAVDPSCRYSILDYTAGMEDADGNKYKKKVREPETGVTYEKYHHFSDGDDYFITKLLSKQYRTFLRGGKAYNYDAIIEEGRFEYV